MNATLHTFIVSKEAIVDHGCPMFEVPKGLHIASPDIMHEVHDDKVITMIYLESDDPKKSC